MSRKHKVHNPFNFAFEIMYSDFAEELHENLKVPGKFRKKVNKKAYFNNGQILEMDASYIIDPDNVDVFESMVVNLEHQTNPINGDKIRILSQYKIQQIADEKLPHLSVIATNTDVQKSVQIYERTYSDILRPYFLDLGEGDNKKRLNKINNIVNNNEELTDKEALNLGIILLFAPKKQSKEITRKVVKLYIRINSQISKKMEYTLYSVLCAMIDAYFEDENEFNRMMDMIDEITSDESREEYESVRTAKNKVNEIKELMAFELNNANNEIADLKIKNGQANETIANLKKEVDLLKKQLNKLYEDLNLT